METCAEIIAKKFWYRGQHGKARDLFDLCAVAIAEPAAIEPARPFLQKNAPAFLKSLDDSFDVSREEFEQIDTIDFKMDFEQCLLQAKLILEA